MRGFLHPKKTRNSVSEFEQVERGEHTQRHMEIHGVFSVFVLGVHQWSLAQQMGNPQVANCRRDMFASMRPEQV